MMKPKFDDLTQQLIADDYKAGQSISSIANDHCCATATVINILKKRNVQRRPRGNVFSKVSEQQANDIARLWQEGESQNSIGSKYGLTQTNVSRLLSRMGFEIEHRQPKRERHGRWKGGIHIDQSGYRHIKLQCDDQYFCMANAGGYVLEHRYFLARKLGRPLHANETVHHIDGNRTNNSLDNLQLRQGQHGTGMCHVCLDCGSHNIKAVRLDG